MTSQWPDTMKGPCRYCGDTITKVNAGHPQHPRYVDTSHDCQPGTPEHLTEEYYWGDRD